MQASLSKSCSKLSLVLASKCPRISRKATVASVSTQRITTTAEVLKGYRFLKSQSSRKL
jgi:hypothetical protein